MSSIKILAIETSCDESAAAIVSLDPSGNAFVLSSVISSQVELHAEWGGVVPNLAAREHLKNLPLVVEKSLKESRAKISDITALAVTNGPGLIPALLIGTEFAKTLAYRWDKPLLGIHHIEGHICANFIGSVSGGQFPVSVKNPSASIQNSQLKTENSFPGFPALCLVVSGGHTQLVLMREHFQYEIIGQTLDDAAGEAFDKVARILDIGYPGGPAVAARAANFQNPNVKCQIKSRRQYDENDDRPQTADDKSFFAKKYEVSLPRPMLNKKNFDFSFSGLKTAVLYETKKHPELLKEERYVNEICHEFQQAAIDVLVAKTIKAAAKYKPQTIMLAGGVSANMELRQQLGAAIKKNLPGVLYRIPDLALTGDNAAMIGAAAVLRWQKMNISQKEKASNSWKTLQTDANLKL